MSAARETLGACEVTMQDAENLLTTAPDPTTALGAAEDHVRDNIHRMGDFEACEAFVVGRLEESTYSETV